MAYAAGNFDATIAAAAGDDTALYRELRDSFVASLARQIDLLRRARCDGNWLIAAQRIHGLAASFQADGLVTIAERTCDAAPGDPVVLRDLQEYHDTLAAA